MADLITELTMANIWEQSLELDRNDFLKRDGDKDLNIYFIEEGCLRLYILDEEYEHTIRFGYQHNVVTALDSYISELPSDLYIQAVRKTKVKVVSKQKFTDFIESSTVLKSTWVNLLEQLIYQQLEREKDILIHSPAERYSRVLKRSPQLFQEVPHKYIASYLRMSPETLSRLKR